MQTDSLLLDLPSGCACKAEHVGLTSALGRPQGNGKATHSSVLAWRIPGTGEPGRLLSLGSHRLGHD